VIIMSFHVKDFMSEDVPTVDEGVSVTEAAKTMSESGQGFLIVLTAGRPTGIVTENDFVNKVLARELDPKTVQIAEIMSAPLISVDPDEDLLKVSEKMTEHDIRRLPVLKDGIIYGVICSKDIAEHCSMVVDQSIKDLIKWTSMLPSGL
jgi:CBS domain-containing protein